MSDISLQNNALNVAAANDAVYGSENVTVTSPVDSVRNIKVFPNDLPATPESITSDTVKTVSDHITASKIRTDILKKLDWKFPSLGGFLFRRSGIEGQQVIDYGDLVQTMRAARKAVGDIPTAANDPAIKIAA